MEIKLENISDNIDVFLRDSTSCSRVKITVYNSAHRKVGEVCFRGDSELDKKEYIICAAIWYKDLPTQHLLPNNIDKGVVIAGLRHGHCIHAIKALSGLRTVTYAIDATGEHEQGFITNTNRFVDRQEGFNIAEKQNQLNDRERGASRTLYSEDLY